MKKYFKFKIKDEYLPDFIKEFKKEGKIIDGVMFKSSDILSIDNKYIRLLKINNLENNISKRDKEFLEFLLDDRFVVFLTKEQCDFLKKVASPTTTSTSNSVVNTSYNSYYNYGIKHVNSDYYITINDNTTWL